MLCFSHPNSKDVTNLETLPQSRECRDVKKLYRNNGHIIIHHGTSTNQLEKLFHTHFWVILVRISVVPPIQLIPPQNRVFVPLTVARVPWVKSPLVTRVRLLSRGCRGEAAKIGSCRAGACRAGAATTQDAMA